MKAKQIVPILVLMGILITLFCVYGVKTYQKNKLKANARDSLSEKKPVVKIAKPNIPVSPGELNLARGNNAFAFKLFGKIKKPKENLFFSPYSLSSALSMAYAGSGGQTAAELAKVLGFSQSLNEQNQNAKALQQRLNALNQPDSVQLNVANALICDTKFQPFLNSDYRKLLIANYSSEFFTKDFSQKQPTVDFVNGWIESKTNKRIKDLLKPENLVDNVTAMLLVNAIFFKANWQQPFEKKNTKADYFYPSATDHSAANRKKVDLMDVQENFAYTDMDGMQILELPYVDTDISMLVFLPKKLTSLESKLNMENYKRWTASLSNQKVRVFLPKFDMTYTCGDLPKVLKTMGIQTAFDKRIADFELMLKPEARDEYNMFIQDVLHKAFVEVNESGSEAAAATIVVMGTAGCAAGVPQPPPIPVFRADHPFIFVIRHIPTDTILFMGKLCDPPDAKL